MHRDMAIDDSFRLSPLSTSKWIQTLELNSGRGIIVVPLNCCTILMCNDEEIHFNFPMQRP